MGKRNGHRLFILLSAIAVPMFVIAVLWGVWGLDQPRLRLQAAWLQWFPDTPLHMDPVSIAGIDVLRAENLRLGSVARAQSMDVDYGSHGIEAIRIQGLHIDSHQAEPHWWKRLLHRIRHSAGHRSDNPVQWQVSDSRWALPSGFAFDIEQANWHRGVANIVVKQGDDRVSIRIRRRQEQWLIDGMDSQPLVIPMHWVEKIGQELWGINLASVEHLRPDRFELKELAIQQNGVINRVDIRSDTTPFFRQLQFDAQGFTVDLGDQHGVSRWQLYDGAWHCREGQVNLSAVTSLMNTKSSFFITMLTTEPFWNCTGTVLNFNEWPNLRGHLALKNPQGHVGIPFNSADKKLAVTEGQWRFTSVGSGSIAEASVNWSTGDIAVALEKLSLKQAICGLLVNLAPIPRSSMHAVLPELLYNAESVQFRHQEGAWSLSLADDMSISHTPGEPIQWRCQDMPWSQWQRLAPTPSNSGWQLTAQQVSAVGELHDQQVIYQTTAMTEATVQCGPSSLTPQHVSLMQTANDYRIVSKGDGYTWEYAIKPEGNALCRADIIDRTLWLQDYSGPWPWDDMTLALELHQQGPKQWIIRRCEPLTKHDMMPLQYNSWRGVLSLRDQTWVWSGTGRHIGPEGTEALLQGHAWFNKTSTNGQWTASWNNQRQANIVIADTAQSESSSRFRRWQSDYLIGSTLSTGQLFVWDQHVQSYVYPSFSPQWLPNGNLIIP